MRQGKAFGHGLGAAAIVAGQPGRKGGGVVQAATRLKGLRDGIWMGSALLPVEVSKIVDSVDLV